MKRFVLTIPAILAVFTTLQPAAASSRSEQSNELALAMLGPSMWGATLIVMPIDAYSSARFSVYPEKGVEFVIAGNDRYGDGLFANTVGVRTNGLWFGAEVGHEMFRFVGRTNSASFGTEHEFAIALQRPHHYADSWSKTAETRWHPRFEFRKPYDSERGGWRHWTFQIAADCVFF
ncbi:hypothetical protein HY375_03525 [Candidatus Berkelbacteria bacterium]|nr:hypothetical protein [Candidatus Berkelbacteria bacterium]